MFFQANFMLGGHIAWKLGQLSQTHHPGGWSIMYRSKYDRLVEWRNVVNTKFKINSKLSFQALIEEYTKYAQAQAEMLGGL